jgi:hypothetical protein
MRAMLTREWPELTTPTNSSMSFGLLPAARMRVGAWMSLGMVAPV